MAEPLRVAVVGVGVGQGHIRAYTALAAQYNLVALCDLNVPKAEALAEEFGVPHVTADLAELCARDDLDAINLCTPPFLHFEQIAQILASGKHVICEKPLVGSLRDVDALAELERQSGRWIMPIFQYRFGHGLQKLKLLIDAGLTGPASLTTVETAWRRRADYYTVVPWRGTWRMELGGALLGHAIHAHDMLTYALGPIRRVYARATTRINRIEVEDCAAATAELADGSLATLGLTLGSAAEVTRHRFCFANLTAESNTRPYTNSGDPWQFHGDTPDDSIRIEEALATFNPLPEGYQGQFYRFAEALRAGAPPPVTLADGRASIELVAALYHSSRTGEAVTLPLGTDHPLYGGWEPGSA